MYDVVAIGEVLIDFASKSADADGYPTMAANPGGAPCNFLSALNAYGKKTAFLGKVGDDAFGHLLLGTLRKAGIDTKGILVDPDVFTTLAFVTFDASGDRSFSFARKPGADTQLRWDELDRTILDVSVFIREHYDFLLSFDLVKIYYDNGQVELNKILSTLFNAFLPRVEFRKVKPSDYRLFQVADMICTFELLKLKIQNHSFSKSEQIFFGSVNDLKRNYLKIVKRQDIDH